MSAALPRLSGQQVVTALGRAGFEVVGTRGSHCELRRPDDRRVVIVPLHREVATGTLASILRQAGLDRDGLRGLLADS